MQEAGKSHKLSLDRNFTDEGKSELGLGRQNLNKREGGTFFLTTD